MKDRKNTPQLWRLANLNKIIDLGIYTQRKYFKYWQLGHTYMADLTDIFLKDFGKKVRAERESQKLTLEDMEFHTGIDTSDFNKIELGKTNITLKTLLKVSKGLKVQPQVLLDFRVDFENE